MSKFFHDLGERVDRAWGASNFSHAAFPRICAEALAAASPSEHVTLEEVFGGVFEGGRLPTQADPESEFGEPPLTLYFNDRFHVTIDFWVDSTTCIHDHSFSGAFHVLEGSSIHTSFDFQPREPINEHFILGDLCERGIERLRKGDTRTIEGRKTIHSLFHLDRPSATVVIRTWRDPTSGPLYTYERSGISYSTLYDRVQIRRRCELLRLVQRTKPGLLPEYCKAWMKSADFVTRFIGLRYCLGLMSPEEGDALLQDVGLADERLARLIGSVITEDRREAAIVRKRSLVTDAELRFFLAVLLNVRGRHSALRLVREQFPERDPVEAIVRWCYALDRLDAEPAQPRSPLGFAMDDVVATTFAGLLRGEGAEAVARKVSTVAQRRLRRRDRVQLDELAQALTQSELFRHLLH